MCGSRRKVHGIYYANHNSSDYRAGFFLFKGGSGLHSRASQSKCARHPESALISAKNAEIRAIETFAVRFATTAIPASMRARNGAFCRAAGLTSDSEVTLDSCVH